MVRRKLVAGWGVAMVLAGCGRAPGESGSVDASIDEPRASRTSMTVSFDGPIEGASMRFLPEPGGLRVEQAVALPPRSTARVARVHLPATADGTFRVEEGSMAVEARLLGAAPVGARVVGDRVRYAGAFAGASIEHAPTHEGTEEWIAFAKRPKARELRYDVTLVGVAGLRLAADTLELLDRTGDPRLRVTRPVAIDAKGVRREGWLDVEGCAVDRDLRAPWGRAVTPPGSARCTVVAHFDDEGLAYPLQVDPAWVTTGSLSHARRSHAAVGVQTASGTCASGCVVVVGGVATTATNGATVATPELYNMATGTFSDVPIGTLTFNASTGIAAGSLQSATAWFVGGATSTTAGSSYGIAFDAGTLTWSQLPQFPYGDFSGGALVPWGYLSNAGFMLAGITQTSGTSNVGPTSSVFLIQQGSGGWYKPANTMSVARATTFAVSYSGGAPMNALCVISGGGSVDADCTTLNGNTSGPYDPVWTHYATALTTAPDAMSSNTSYTLFTSRAGGLDLLDMTKMTCSSPPCGGFSHLSATVAAGINGRVGASRSPRWMFTGGDQFSTAGFFGVSNVDYVTASSVSSNPSIAASDANALVVRRFEHSATAAGNSVLVAGGIQSTGIIAGALTSAEIFAPAAQGTACAVSAECSGSLSCVDGVCCDVSGAAVAGCAGTCESCSVPGHVGTCIAEPAGSQPATGHSACPTPQGGTCGYACDGTNRSTCTAAGGGVVCSPSSCSAGIETNAADCSGTGTCNAPTTTNCSPYACNAASTACNTTCTVNTDCATGYKCVGTACVPTGGAGSSCSITSDCQAGLACVDGTCCTSSSCPSGEHCNVAPAAGSCKLPYGAACTASSATSCATGNCVDGVCCDTACTGQCQACDLTGSIGKCSTVIGGQPHGTRTACTGSGVCQAICDGSSPGACGPAPGPTVVCAAASCASGTQTATSYCNGLGACSTGASTSCFEYVCGPSACKTTCTSLSDCAAGYTCKSGACVTTGGAGSVCMLDTDCTSGHCVDGACCAVASCPSGQVCSANGKGTCSQANGTTCTSSSACGSGNCVDGVCCDKACTGECEACDVASSIGTCTAVAGKPHGSRTACTGVGACQAQCDGSNRLACASPPGTSTTCAAPSCTGNVASAAAYCDGAGNCTTATTTACKPYVCGATACKTTCASDADCQAGYGCSGNACVPKKGVACTTSADCTSGFCVDGVCCDSPCTGECEACDVAGAVGTCSAVIGAPHGARTPCFDGGGDACRALSCDGSDRAKCVGFANGPETTCTPATCANGTFTPAAHCDGHGTCPSSTAQTCTPYVCDATSSTPKCKTTCATTADCATGYLCTSGTCSAITANCSADGTQSIPVDGRPPIPCAPYACDDASGQCYSNCVRSEQCVSGASCGDGVCTSAGQSATNPSGGCSVGDAPSSEAPGTLALALAMIGGLGLGARRRRRR